MLWVVQTPFTQRSTVLRFYLFRRVKLVHSAGMRCIKCLDKRLANPDDMVANRRIRVPLQHDPNHPESVQLHDFEVMMAALPDDNEAIAQAYVTSDLRCGSSWTCHT